jgi:hypothetical protein
MKLFINDSATTFEAALKSDFDFLQDLDAHNELFDENNERTMTWHAYYMSTADRNVSRKFKHEFIDLYIETGVSDPRVDEVLQTDAKSDRIVKYALLASQTTCTTLASSVNNESIRNHGLIPDQAVLGGSIYRDSIWGQFLVRVFDTSRSREENIQDIARYFWIISQITGHGVEEYEIAGLLHMHKLNSIIKPEDIIAGLLHMHKLNSIIKPEDIDYKGYVIDENTPEIELCIDEAIDKFKFDKFLRNEPLFAIAAILHQSKPIAASLADDIRIERMTRKIEDGIKEAANGSVEVETTLKKIFMVNDKGEEVDEA